MAITAAQVEPNGWVLRLTLTAALTSPRTDYTAYEFDVEGAPRVTLASSHPGFVKSGGAAVPGSFGRSTVGTWPLRLPVDPANALVSMLDETDLGGGVIQVRIALSETIYATETGLSLATLAGWRRGEAAQSGLSVTNSSTVVAPMPIFRWVLPSYEVTSGAFRLSLLVASHHPVGFDPVAGVKFTVTDGTRVKTMWATALATDNSYGDDLRCHSVIIDPATAAALTAGLLRCDAEVYPWLGTMRSTDPAGTNAMAGLNLAGQMTRAEAPFVIGYDPSSDRYDLQYAFVDPVNGTTTPAIGMIAGSRAAAKAVDPAARPRNITTAIQAAATINRTLAAANGQAASTRALDGLTITLAAGVHAGVGTTAVSSTAKNPEIPILVEGDPDDANPRDNCIVETQAVGNFNIRISKLRWRNMTIKSGGTGMLSAGTSYHWFDNVTITARAGDEAVSTGPVGVPTLVADNFSYTFTRCRIWKTGFRVGNGNPQCNLFRASENARRVNAITIVKNRFIPVDEDGTTAGNTFEGYGTWPKSSDQGALEDVFLAYNDVRKHRWTSWVYNRVPAATWGGAFDRTTRHVLLCNLFERTSDSGDTSDAFWSFSNAGTCTTSYYIVEGNTHAGGAYSAFYNIPTIATVADTNSAFSETMVIRCANNSTDRNASKHDNFNDSATLSIRIAGGVPGATGYRPHLTQCWDTHWGVNQEANVDCSRKGSISVAADFHEYFGRRAVQFRTPTSPGYVDDRSEAAANTGLGDYRPVAGSVLLNRVTRGNSDRDFAGKARLMNGAAGAFEGGDSAVGAANGRHLQRAASSAIGIVLPVAPTGAVIGHRAQASALLVQGMLIPASSLLIAASRGAAIGTGDATQLLAPAGGRLVFTVPPTLLLPDGSASAERTLNVRMDARMIFVTETRQEI